MIFDDSVNENKELLRKYADVWDGIKNEIKAINGGKENNYRKDYMKIKFNSDDDLPLNKPLKFHAMTIIIRSVFEEGGKLYPQVYLDEALYELWKCYSTKNLVFQKKLTLIKQVHQKNVCFVIIGILNMLDLNLNHMFVINAMIVDNFLWNRKHCNFMEILNMLVVNLMIIQFRLKLDRFYCTGVMN